MRGVWKAWAFFERDLRIDGSYKLSFALQGIHILVAIAAFSYLAQLVKSNPQGYASFPFLLVGMAVNGYMTTSLVCFAQGIRSNQLTGTLKAILATQTSPVAVILLSSLYPFARAAIDATLYLIGGLLFGMSLGQINLPAALMVFVLSLVAFGSVGIVSATFSLVFKRGDPALWLFASVSWLLGGVLYPVEVLPRSLQTASHLLPLTHALDGMRAALLRAAPVGELLPQLWALALFAVLGLPASLLAFNLGLRRAKATGTLGHW